MRYGNETVVHISSVRYGNETWAHISSVRYGNETVVHISSVRYGNETVVHISGVRYGNETVVHISCLGMRLLLLVTTVHLSSGRGWTFYHRLCTPSLGSDVRQQGSLGQ